MNTETEIARGPAPIRAPVPLEANRRSDLVAQIREQYRTRCELARAAQKLRQSLTAVCLRILGETPSAKGYAAAAKLLKEYDAVAASKNGAQPSEAVILLLGTSVPIVYPMLTELTRRRLKIDRELEQLAKEFPVWSAWAEGVRGFGPLSLAIVIGEAGDIGAWPSWRALWKRFGLLAIGPDGSRQRRIANNPELATLHGYCPRRAAVAYNLSEAIVKSSPPKYRAVYDETKTAIAEREPGWTKMHCHRYAKRKAVQALLRDLWCEWRDADRR